MHGHVCLCRPEWAGLARVSDEADRAYGRRLVDSGVQFSVKKKAGNTSMAQVLQEMLHASPAEAAAIVRKSGFNDKGEKTQSMGEADTSGRCTASEGRSHSAAHAEAAPQQHMHWMSDDDSADYSSGAESHSEADSEDDPSPGALGGQVARRRRQLPAGFTFHVYQEASQHAACNLRVAFKAECTEHGVKRILRNYTRISAFLHSHRACRWALIPLPHACLNFFSRRGSRKEKYA